MCSFKIKKKSVERCGVQHSFDKKQTKSNNSSTLFKVNFISVVFSVVLLLSQKQALEELKQTVQQLRCSEVKFAAQKELLEQKVQENDGKDPPPVVNYEEDARSVTSMVNPMLIMLSWWCSCST